MKTLSDLLAQANANVSTLVFKLDTLSPHCDQQRMSTWASKEGLHWAFPPNSTLVFLSNSEPVAVELGRAKVHDEAGYDALFTKASLAHYRELAQVAKASQLVAGGAVSTEVAKSLALVALRNVTVAPAVADVRPVPQFQHRVKDSGLPLLYPAAVARRVPETSGISLPFVPLLIRSGTSSGPSNGLMVRGSESGMRQSSARPLRCALRPVPKTS